MVIHAITKPAGIVGVRLIERVIQLMEYLGAVHVTVLLIDQPNLGHLDKPHTLITIGQLDVDNIVTGNVG